MDGKPFKVGRFAHTLRVRLMREHLGVDVDAMYEEDLMASDPIKPETEIQTWDPDEEQDPELTEGGRTKAGKSREHRGMGTMAQDLGGAITQGRRLLPFMPSGAHTL